MQPNLADATIEYLFTPQESILARTLDPLKIAHYQTKYAQLWKARNSITAPVDPKDDRQYFLQIAEFDGKMGMLQELFDDHKRALQDQQAVQDELVEMEQQRQTAVQVATRAANLVDKTS